MRPIPVVSWAVAALILCTPATDIGDPPVSGLAPAGLRTEYLAHPLRLDSTAPRLSRRVD
jgi:hypothetical protein